MHQRSRFAIGLLPLTVFTLPLLYGGVTEAAAFILVGAAFLFFVLTHGSADESNVTLSAQRQHLLAPALMPLLLAAIWQTLLVIPWPFVFGFWLSPWATEAKEAVYALQPLSRPRFSSLTLVPQVAALDAARLWATLVLATGVCKLSHHRLIAQRLVEVLAAAGLMQVAYALFYLLQNDTLHRAVRSIETLLPGSFINPNHQGAFFALAFSASMALGCYAQTLPRKMFAFAAAFVLFISVFLTLSRGAIAAVCVGALVWVLGLLRRRSRSAGIALVCVAAGVLGACYLAFGAIEGEFSAQHFYSKLDVFPDALKAVRHVPLGAGRGGYEPLDNWLRPPARASGRYEYVENEYIQALIDYGPLAGLIAIGFALAMVCYVFRVLNLSRAKERGENASRWPYFYALNLLAMLVMLAVHNCVDFNWEISAIFVPIWLLIAGMSIHHVRPFYTAPWVTKGIRVRPLQALSLVCALGTLALAQKQDVSRWEADLKDTHIPLAAKERAALRMIAVKPLDPWPQWILAQIWLAQGDHNQAVAWLSSALSLNPQWAEIHVLLGQMWCQSGQYEQGVSELKQALERERTWVKRVLTLYQTACHNPPGGEVDLVNEGDGEMWALIFKELLTLPQQTAALRALTEHYLSQSLYRDPRVLEAMADFVRVLKEPLLHQRMMSAFASIQTHPAYQRAQAEWAWRLHQTQESQRLWAQLATRPDAEVVDLINYIDVLKANQQWREVRFQNERLALLSHQKRLWGIYHANLAALSLSEHRPFEAAGHYQAAFMSNPHDVKSALSAIDLLLESGHLQTAQEFLTAAQKLSADPALKAKRDLLEKKKE